MRQCGVLAGPGLFGLSHKLNETHPFTQTIHCFPSSVCPLEGTEVGICGGMWNLWVGVVVHMKPSRIRICCVHANGQKYCFYLVQYPYLYNSSNFHNKSSDGKVLSTCERVRSQNNSEDLMETNMASISGLCCNVSTFSSSGLLLEPSSRKHDRGG